MSQPAIARGRLFMAYPGGNARGVQRGDQPAQKAAPVGPAKGDGYRLLCADLFTGKRIWEQDITGEVISAPVIDGDQVLLTCFDGTTFRIDANTGAIIWKKENSGTSAPVVADGRLIISEKRAFGNKVSEGIQLRNLSGGQALSKELAAEKAARYLEHGREGSTALPMMQSIALGKENMYISSASGHLMALSLKDGRVQFMYDTKRPMAFQPALAKGNLYVGTIDGMLLCLRTGFKDADGWHAWGGNAQHNKKQ